MFVLVDYPQNYLIDSQIKWVTKKLVPKKLVQVKLVEHNGEKGSKS